MAVYKRTWMSGGRTREGWQVDFSLGSLPKDRVRKSGFVTRREAEDWERRERARREEGALLARLPAEQRRRLAAAERTVADLARAWLEACKDGADSGIAVEPRTYKGYESSVRLHIDPRIGTAKIADVDGPMLNQLKARLLREVTPATARRVLQHVRQMLNYAVRVGWLAASPGGSIRLKVDRRAMRKLRMPSDRQFATLLDAIETLRAEAEADAERCRRERQDDPKAGAMYDEPPRVRRRPLVLGHAARAGALIWT
jgi:hypothetical protein